MFSGFLASGPMPYGADGASRPGTFFCFVLVAFGLGCLMLTLWRYSAADLRPAGLRGRTSARSSARGWGLLLLAVATAAAVVGGRGPGLVPEEVGLAVLAIVFAPKVAAKLVPYGLLGLAVFGVHLAKMYRDGFTNQ